MIYNGKLLEFEDDCADKSHCSYQEFMQMIQFKGFVNTSTHYEHECAKKWSPNHNAVQNLLYRNFRSAAFNIYQNYAEDGQGTN